MAVTYKIGEAAALLRLKTYVLRFWETEFPQIVPLRTEKGQRLYTEEHLALLDRIRFLLHEHGLTIEGARKVLAEEAGRGVRYAHPVPPGRPAPVSARARGTTGISVSGHKTETGFAGRSGAGRDRAGRPPSRQPEKAASGESFPPAAAPPFPAGETVPPPDRIDRLSPEKAEPSDPGQAIRSRRDIMEELEAVAALLRGAPSGNGR
jgi:DNA-binding transcriptional MerR regulator